MMKVICIVGPTGVGKTELSLTLAEALETEIISCDSMQIYRGMDIGTAKVKPEETRGIKHHMIDVVEPIELFSSWEYRNQAGEIAERIANSGRIPLFVGGTGLYANAILYDLQFMGERQPEIRAKWQNFLDKNGKDALFKRLLQVDPAQKDRIHPNNTRRVLRALEIYEETGKPMSEQISGMRAPREDMDALIIGLTGDRETVYERINDRVDRMMEEGLIEEAENLVHQYPDFASTRAAQGIGYKETLRFLDGEITEQELRELIAQNTRRYAKRQWTWFGKDPRTHWVDIGTSEMNEIINMVKEWGSERT